MVRLEHQICTDEIFTLHPQQGYPVLPSDGYAQLRIYNGVPDCSYRFNTNLPTNATFTLRGLDHFEQRFVRTANGSFRFEYSIETYSEECPQLPSGVYVLPEHTASGLFLQPAVQETAARLLWYADDVQKSARGQPLMRTLANLAPPDRTVLWYEVLTGVEGSKQPVSYHELFELRPTDYAVYVDDVLVHRERLRNGGVYAFVIGAAQSDGNLTTELFEVTEPNALTVLWLVPQYFVLTLGEVMFSVTGLEFSYREAPVSMKTVVQACWMLTVAFGSLIVVIVAEAKAFESQASEFFLFAGLMFLDMLVFMWLAHQYQLADTASKRAVDQNVKYTLRPKYTRKATADE